MWLYAVAVTAAAVSVRAQTQTATNTPLVSAFATPSPSPTMAPSPLPTRTPYLVNGAVDPWSSYDVVQPDDFCFTAGCAGYSNTFIGGNMYVCVYANSCVGCGG